VNDVTRSIPELITAATDWTRDDGCGDWDAVVALHRIGSREVLDHAVVLVASDDPRARARGADILGQLGSPGQTFLDDRLNAVIKLITLDTDPRVLQAAASALGHIGDSRGTEALISISRNADPDVRHAVAFALGGRAEPAAIATLIRLTTDEDAHVRDWATFGIGELGDSDTSEIREALNDRLNDPDSDTRYEAVCGLAKRADRRVLPLLIRALRTDTEDGSLYTPAMAFLGIDDGRDTPTADELIILLEAMLQ